MPLTPEQKQKIAAALSARVLGPSVCPICHTQNWSIGDDLVKIPLQPDAAVMALGGPAYPLIPLVCSRCGNTHLLNVLVLGVGDLFGLKPEFVATPAAAGGEKANG